MTTGERDTILQTLIDCEWPKLHRFFSTKVPACDVLDLAQSTMLAFIEGGLRDPGAARAYLWSIARKQVLKYYEKHRGRADPFDSEHHTAMDLGPSLSSKLDQRNRVVAALRTLPADQQMAIELRYGEDLKLEEVAEVLGVSLATVKRYIAAATEKLRAELGSVDEVEVAEAYKKL
jgi:RNA polymerase sigma-70 factor (ECF subfamily)